MPRALHIGLALALFLLALGSATLWQWQALAHQQLDIGLPLDDGAILFAHAPERSTNDPTLTFRWTEPHSELRLAAGPGTSILVLHAFLPPGVPAHTVMLRSDTQKPIPIQMTSSMRRYALMLAPTAQSERILRLDATPVQLANDGRRVGLALDWLRLDTPTPPNVISLLRMAGQTPALLISLLILAICAALLRLAPLSSGALALLAFGVLAAGDRLLPGAGLRLIPYLTLFAGALVLAVTGFELAKLTGLLPTCDAMAWRWVVGICTLVFVLSFVPSIKEDGMRYYVYLRSLALDHDLQFANEFSRMDRHGFDAATATRTITNHIENNASVGPAIVWTPLFFVAHGLALLAPMLNLSSWQADGYGQPYIVLIAFGSVLAGLVTMFSCFWIVRRWVGPGIAALTAIALLTGSNLLYYSMREGSFSHAISAATASLFVLAWLRLEEAPGLRRWAILGVAAGAVAVSYWIGVLTFVLPGMTFLRLMITRPGGRQGLENQESRRVEDAKDRTTKKDTIIGAGLAAGLALLTFAPQMLAWWVIYGSPLVIPHGGDYVRPRNPQIMSMLFSHLYGLLPWTPAFFAGLLGLPFLWRRSRWLTVCLLLSGGLYFLYNASLGRWFAGGSFGLRRLTLLTPWFAIGLALLLQALKSVRPGLAVGLVGLMSSWALLLLVRYDLFLIPHVPEKIEDMPVQAFYLSREVLPFWGLEPWLRSSFFAQALYGFASPAAALSFVILTATMALIGLILVLILGRKWA